MKQILDLQEITLFGANDMLPNTLILNTHRTLLHLRKQATGLGKSPDLADDISQTLIDDVLFENKTALRKLREYVHKVRIGECEYEDDYIDSELAFLILALGEEIYHQLCHLRIYGLNGVLPYHFHLACIDGYNNDVMLTRTETLAYQHEHTFDSKRIEYGSNERLSVSPC